MKYSGPECNIAVRNAIEFPGLPQWIVPYIGEFTLAHQCLLFIVIRHEKLIVCDHARIP